jgi:hypothetical protein
MNDEKNPLIFLIKNLPQKRAGFLEIYQHLYDFIVFGTNYFGFDDDKQVKKALSKIQNKFRQNIGLRNAVETVIVELSLIDNSFSNDIANQLQGIPFMTGCS